MKRCRFTVQQMFESKFTPEPNTGCWLWHGGGARTALGYGVFGARRLAVNKTTISAHRASWLIYKGEIPSEMFVCHRCDNPHCVNPDHLFLGTPKDNVVDCMGKQRNSSPPIRRGEINNKAKLTAVQVRNIRSRYKESYQRGNADNQMAMAQEFNVTQANISCILKMKTWKHI